MEIFVSGERLIHHTSEPINRLYVIPFLLRSSSDGKYRKTGEGKGARLTDEVSIYKGEHMYGSLRQGVIRMCQRPSGISKAAQYIFFTISRQIIGC